ncbi:armadillo-type protein [Dunaliella salina]|nr:armadillo-type protein [Dunaliella salina]|eukprot:KAF5835979.1 armadillo-type protein [Dunaliella salina]
MNEPGCVAPLVVPPDATGEDAVPAAGLCARRFAYALLQIIPPKIEDVDPEQLSSVLLAVHHPGITAPIPPGSGRQVWLAASRRMPTLVKVFPGFAPAVSQALNGPQGLSSRLPAEQTAARQALSTCIALSPNALMPHVLEKLVQLLDRTEHDALPEESLEIFATPEGHLASEWKALQEVSEAVMVVERRNVRKAKGRFKSGGRAFEDDDDDDEPAPPPPPPAAKPAPRSGPAGAKKDAAARQAEWRANELVQESKVREHVRAVKTRLLLGLSVLRDVAAGNPRFAATKLEELRELCQPLLSSKLVGSEAFEAVRQLAACLPAPLGGQALGLAAALRLVVLAQQAQHAGAVKLPAAKEIADVVSALRQVTGDRRPLQGASYRFVFPVLQAILSSPTHTPSHEDALAVVALHCSAHDVPRAASLALLYHLLGVVPAYRERVQPLLKQLAVGAIEHTDILAAARGVAHASALVRGAALAALHVVPALSAGNCPKGDGGELVCLLHMARHDPVESNASAAQGLWELAKCELPRTYVAPLVQLLVDAEAPDTTQAAAAALASAATELPGTVGESLAQAISAYGGGHVSARCGVAAALRALAPVMGPDEVPVALDFLIGNGLADMSEKVREGMVHAGMAIVDVHGAQGARTMMPLFESYLDNKRPGLSAEQEAEYDLVREGVVVFLGTLARHLPADDPKRTVVVDTLITVLATPSEGVQRAVSNCLPPLMGPLSANKELVDGLVTRLLTTLTKGKTFGERRGAAFGLAGVVKGLGLMAMKNCGIMDNLKAAVEDKKDPAAREGALMAFECLSQKLGKLFEPYIIYILPLLLNCFGDTVPSVRAATEDAAHMIMGQLTASGVKLVLPALLKGLEDKVWRTKQGSVQLLGSMSHCAPKQLGSCLPTIVPRLSDVLNDPHPKVQAAANEALREIGSVIRNPEIMDLVPYLLSAIADPNHATKPALEVLLQTVFVNTIDAASLALILPVIHRGLRDRTGDTKKKAARIAGNMASLVNDPKDILPYVPMLMPELQKALIDPLPEVRAMAARAMGSLMQGMGSEQFSDLVPWLMATLASDGSAVERSGAAQGLAEVLTVLGPNHLEAMMPDILEGATSRASPSMREGHLVLMHYLPITMGVHFQGSLQRVLPAILDGLADESEGVRDAALAAGRILVDHYTHTALPLLLPAVENGLLTDNWRIRQSSVKLLGKLLFKGAAEEGYNEAIINALGMDRRNEVLSRLYICRSDPQYTVRNESLHVWKSVVYNTPKTLAAMMPKLMEQVRKLGDRVLGRIIPILKDGVFSGSTVTRRGVCAGIKEVLENISRQQLTEHMSDILPAVQNALTDADPGVREAAGEAFSIMFKGGAGGAVDSVVPQLLEGLAVPQKFVESLEGLRVILGVRPHMSFAEEHCGAATQAAEAVLLAVPADGLQLLVSELLRALEDAGPKRRAAASLLAVFPGRCAHTEELLEHVPILLDRLISLFADNDGEVVLCSWKAVEALVAIIPKEEQAGYVRCVREALATAKENERRKRTGKELLLAGLCLPKALSPLLPIFLQGMLQGASTEAREAAAEGLGEMVALTSQDALRPFVVQITGPLIRIIGDRFPSQIKAAILVTLGLLITKAGPGLKPFVPQLQTTFLKCLSDPADTVRERAATNLGGLSKMSPRVDQLANDLAQSARLGDPVIRNAYLLALSGLMTATGERVSQPVTETVGEALRSSVRIAADDEGYRYNLASCLGAQSRHAPLDLLTTTLTAPGVGPLSPTGLSPIANDRHLQGTVLATVAGCAGPRLEEAGVVQACVDAMIKLSRDKEQPIKVAAGRAATRLAIGNPQTLEAACGVLAALMGPDQPTEVSRQALLSVRRLADAVRAQQHEAGAEEDPLQPHLPTIVPPMCSVAAHTSGPVRGTAERSLCRVLDMDPVSGSPGEGVAKYLAAGPGGTVRSLLTEPFLRRVARISFDDELFTAEEY